MKDLSWEKVLPFIFFALITGIAGYTSYTLRDLTSGVSLLNVQMSAVVERLSATAKQNEDLRQRQDEHSKLIYDINGRVLVLERAK